MDPTHELRLRRHSDRGQRRRVSRKWGGGKKGWRSLDIVDDEAISYFWRQEFWRTSYISWFRWCCHDSKIPRERSIQKVQNAKRYYPVARLDHVDRYVSLAITAHSLRQFRTRRARDRVLNPVSDRPRRTKLNKAQIYVASRSVGGVPIQRCNNWFCHRHPELLRHYWLEVLQEPW